jgi:hypothetical protein
MDMVKRYTQKKAQASGISDAVHGYFLLFSYTAVIYDRVSLQMSQCSSFSCSEVKVFVIHDA